jgi:hypothetical protein
MKDVNYNGIVLGEELDLVNPSGHLDQMFRQTRAYHAQLSQMADVKASMMLTLASLISTFSIRYLEDPYLRWPVAVMIACCLVTIVFAAYAVMPKLSLGKRPNLDDPHCNILFFGIFANLEYDEWVKVMNPIMHDPTRAYEAMLRDIYEMGVYLGRMKYRYIRIAYIAFLVGLVSSTLVFLLVEVVSIVNGS